MASHYENRNYDIDANVSTLASIVTCEVKDEKNAVNEMYSELNTVLSDNNFLTIDAFGRYIASTMFKNSIRQNIANVTVEDIRAKYASILYRINEHCIIDVDRIIKRAHVLYNVFVLMVNTDVVVTINDNMRSALGHNIAYNDEELKMLASNENLYNRLIRVIFQGMKVLCGDKE